MSQLFFLSYVCLWLLFLVQSLLLLLLYRHFGLIAMGTAPGHERDGLAVGEKAPNISGVTARGEQIVWTAKPGRAHLLMFASPDCRPCQRILPSLNELAAADIGADLAVVVAGARETVARLVAKFNPPFLALAEHKRGAHGAYRVRVVPFGFVIDEEGSIRAKGLCSDPPRLQDLLVRGGLNGGAARLNGVVAAYKFEDGHNAPAARLSLQNPPSGG